MTLPLEGIRVIDFTQVEMGPICSQMLGDFGADVIKVERRDVGDIARGKVLAVDGESPPFLSLNRNKRSLAIDLKKPEGMEIVWKLVEKADVVLNNFRPDVMKKAFAIAGYDETVLENKFGGMLRALSLGAPPHGGIAPGVDRIVMLICGEENLREVVLFPMNQRAEDLMMGAPSEVTPKQLRELHIRLQLSDRG